MDNYRKELIKRYTSILLLASTLSACSKKVNCDIKYSHAHKYINDDGFAKYMINEREKSWSYNRLDENLEFKSEEEKNLCEFLNKKDLLRISDNLDLILSLEKEQNDFIEYRYSYTTLLPIFHTIKVGKSTTTYVTYMPVTHYSWTTDINHSRLTGEQRLCHYMYEAYRIEKNEKGKYKVLKSELSESILDIAKDYPYIKENFYKIIDVKYGTEIDYEDGQMEDDEYYKSENNIKEENKKLVK